MSKQTYSKAKGRTWEAQVCDFLRLFGIPAERRRLTGAQDCGDVGAWPLVVVEAKACKGFALAEWMDEMEAEVVNANEKFGGGHVGVVLAKRRGTSTVSQGYAIMSPELAVNALRALLNERAARTDPKGGQAK
jgi:hypothetical protein